MDDCPVRYGRAVYVYVTIIFYTVGTHKLLGWLSCYMLEALWGYVMAVLLHTGAIGSVCDNVMTVLLYAGDTLSFHGWLSCYVSACDDCPLSCWREMCSLCGVWYQVSFVILDVCSLLSGIRNFKSPYKLKMVAIFSFGINILSSDTQTFYTYHVFRAGNHTLT